MITSITIWSVLKILIIIVLAIYIVFSYVIIRQVQLMTDTLVIGFEKQLKFLAFVHFLFAVGVLIFSIIIL
ncbi:MAG: DUF5657 family protein [Microgenomates group bacterium]